MSENESDVIVTKEQDDDNATAEKAEESTSNKRSHDDVPEESEESDNEWIGPLPTEAAAPAKKKKGCFPNLNFRRLCNQLFLLHFSPSL